MTFVMPSFFVRPWDERLILLLIFGLYDTLYKIVG